MGDIHIHDEQVANNNDSQRNMSPVPVIEASGLCKEVTTGGEPLTILRDVSFSVAAGEAVAVVGVSGSGKSTLLALLAGLDTPSAGKVCINGEDLFALNEDGRAALRARTMGFVFQSFQLLPSMTALENVLVPLELRGAHGSRDKAAALLARVGLGERLNHYPKQLSGGEQQRVAIARAFVTEPAIVLADEPTGNLDPATGGQIIDLMFELNRERGTTLVLVTHDETLSARCGRVVRLVGGQVAVG